jgi:hypothetical protein
MYLAGGVDLALHGASQGVQELNPWSMVHSNPSALNSSSTVNFSGPEIFGLDCKAIVTQIAFSNPSLLS